LRLFAALRENIGRSEVELDLPQGATPEDAWRRLIQEHPSLSPRRANLTAAVNRRYVPFSEPLAQGDELAFIPPVSGG